MDEHEPDAVCDTCQGRVMSGICLGCGEASLNYRPPSRPTGPGASRTPPGDAGYYRRPDTPVDTPPGAATAESTVAASSKLGSGIAAERYEILRALGMGGVGVVYLARDRQTTELYAIKVLRPGLRRNADVVTRFRREVEVARKIDHPNVARVYSFNESGDSLFIVMQYIDGVDLGEYVKMKHPPLEQKLAILKAVCSAVDAAHAAGIVHRDLKPANIRVDHEGKPYVLDFGIAAVEEGGDVTRVGALIGTPLYMSPEQAQGKRVDHRSDIYSLGVVFYELVVGRPPFIGESPIAIALKHIREVPFRPRTMNPSIPPIVEKVILHCLEKSPGSRPQRASDIVRAIEEPLERELEAARLAARQVAAEPNSGDLQDLSLFQYLRVLTPIRRNFVLEIVNNQEFGRYHFRSAHLVHAESGNLRDAEVAYNIFYWTRGIYRVVIDAEPPAKETVRIPWIPFVEAYFTKLQRAILAAHGVVSGPLIVDLLDPKGSSVYRYVSDAQFEKRLAEKAHMTLETFQKARTHLRSNELRKVSKSGEDAGILFCYAPGLRHYFYALTEARGDVEALYRWMKNELERTMIEGLHDSLREADERRGTRAANAKVLLAEGEDFLGNLVRIKLRALGMDVFLVREGGKALEVAREFRPDAVVLSTNLPGVGAVDVCRTFAAEERLKRVPIVLLAPPDQHAAVEDLELPGVVRVLEKPIVLEELVEIVARYASRGNAGSRLRPLSRPIGAAAP